MTRIIESRRRFKSRLDAKQDVSRPIPALMGDGAGTIDVPNQPGYVYIRVGDGDLGQAFNNRVPRADNLAIDVGYDPVTDPDRRIFQVLSIRMADYAGGGSTPYANVPSHHATHEFGGGDDVFLSWRRLMGLRVGRPSGYSVTVDEGFILRAGAWLAVLAQTLDLTASKPALATQARYVLIALDAAGVATSTDGALVAVGALDISDCPIPAAGEIPLAAVRMYGTQTSIGDTPSAPDIIDLRFPQAASTGSVYLADLQKGTAQYQVITSGANPYPAAWSGFYVRGTAGGTTNLAVTNTKTLTLTSADDYNLTAERTGAVIVRTATPNIVGDITGNARGTNAVDLQLSRAAATQVASGNYSFVGAGANNTPSGTYSATVAGVSNSAGGVGAITLGGNSNRADALNSIAGGESCRSDGNYSVTLGRRALANTFAGLFIWADSTNAEFNGIAANEFALRARGGFRHAYDDSNYWTAQVSAAGAVTLDATGASARFTFSDAVALSSLTASTAIYADASNVLVSLANAAGYFTNNGAGVFSWSATATPAAHNVLDSTYHSDVLTGAITRGDLLYGNATPKIARLALGGAAGSFVTRDANDVVWSGFYLAGTAAQTYTFPAVGGTVALLNAANVFTTDNTIQGGLNLGTASGAPTGDIYQEGTLYQFTRYGGNPGILARRANGAKGAETQVLSGNTLFSHGVRPWYSDTSQFSATTQALMQFVAAENMDSTHRGTRIEVYTAATGNNNQALAATFGNDKSLTVVGEIRASGDNSGLAGTTALTNATNATVTNTYLVKGGQAASTVNTGWLKLYVGTNVVWVPYWQNATP